MNEIAPVIFAKDGKAFADSRDIADKFGKQHYHVLEAIRKLVKDAPSIAQNFRSFKIKDLSGESTSHVEMTRDGFMLLVMGFTGKKALEWKVRYVEAFNKMEQALQDRRRSIREEGKKARNTLTATLAKHGVRRPGEYADVTNSMYVAFWDKNAAALRKAKGLPAKANLRDHMSEVGLGMVMLAEALTSERITVTDQQGVDQCSAAATTCAKVIRNAVLEERESRKLIGD